MSDEHQRLLDQISQVAGQINRAKNQAAGIAQTPPSYAPTRPYGHARGRGGYYRGSIARGGYRVGKTPTHRHRSLVLNGATPSSSTDVSGPVSASTSASTSASSPSWVTKSDRHLQLINTSIYQEHADARAKAIEQTRLQHMRQKENRERNRLINHLTRSGVTSAVSADSTSAPVYEIMVDGIKFAVVKGGSKLVKVPGDANAPKLTPKVAVVGGVKFYRTKNGNMYRHAAVKAQRYVTHSGDGLLLTAANYRQSGAVSKNRAFATCLSFSPDRGQPSLTIVCSGSCPKGPACRYIHDYSKVAACKNLLQKGSCVYGDQCNLSHDLTAERTPHCVHYAKGNCSKDDCPYTHRVLSPGAPVCRDFGIYGYCDKGISCPDRHSFECPDFSNTGVCNTKGCKLPHREYANVLRKAAAAREQATAEDDDGDDPSSDDEGDSVGSDEVDSDEVDEFVGEDGSVGFGDQDFISV